MARLIVVSALLAGGAIAAVLTGRVAPPASGRSLVIEPVHVAPLEMESSTLAVPGPVDRTSTVQAVPLAETSPREERPPPACDAPGPEATLLGRVVGAGGRGAQGVVVTLEVARSQRPVAATTGLDGLFQFLNVPEGEHRICVGEGESFLPKKTVDVHAPTTLLEDWALPELGALEVRVVDEFGRGISDVHVACVGHPRGRRVASTDTAGRLRFEGLPAGHGRVYASLGGVGRGNRPFELSPVQITQVEILLVERGGGSAACIGRSRGDRR